MSSWPVREEGLVSTLMSPLKAPAVRCLCVRHDESVRKGNTAVCRVHDEFLSLSLLGGRANEVLLCGKVATGPLDLNFQ